MFGVQSICANNVDGYEDHSTVTFSLWFTFYNICEKTSYSDCILHPSKRNPEVASLISLLSLGRSLPRWERSSVSLQNEEGSVWRKGETKEVIVTITQRPQLPDSEGELQFMRPSCEPGAVSVFTYIISPNPSSLLPLRFTPLVFPPAEKETEALPRHP